MKTYKLKTTNPKCPKIVIVAMHILEAIEASMALYHGLIEEEITSVKEQINF